MAVTKKTIVTIDCDHCGRLINNDHDDTKFLRIGDHSLTFHTTCFTGMSSSELLYHMGRDESVIYTVQANGVLKKEGLRLRDPRALRQDGTIDRSRATETVDWKL